MLAQNNDQRHEQVFYYLSRTMIGAEHRYNPIEKECLALVFVVQNATLLGGLDYKCHIKSQPFEITHDKAIIAKWSTDKMGHTAILI